MTEKMLPQILHQLSSKSSKDELNFDLNNDCSEVTVVTNSKEQQIHFLEKTLQRLRLEERSIQLENQQIKKQLQQSSPDTYNYQQLLVQKQKDQRNQISKQRQTLCQYKFKLSEINEKYTKARAILKRLEEHKQKQRTMERLVVETEGAAEQRSQLQQQIVSLEERVEEGRRQIDLINLLKGKYQSQQKEIARARSNVRNLSTQLLKNKEILGQMDAQVSQLAELMGNDFARETDGLAAANVQKRAEQTKRRRELMGAVSQWQEEFQQLLQANGELSHRIKEFFKQIRTYQGDV